MSGLPTGIISHTRKVQSLYKRSLRNLEDWYHNREIYRYHAVHMRKRFDDNADIKNISIANDLLSQGEEELFQGQHSQQKKFPESPGGVAHGRVVQSPDWVLDYWHPLEKAQFPEYFARREQRKKEFVKAYLEKYGNEPLNPHH